ncbi:MAG: tetratricopeptide repeat protein [Planctomycetota bacterium]
MIRKLSYLLGASGWVALYTMGQEIFHYSWALILSILGYLLYYWGCGIQKKTGQCLIYTKQRKTVYDYEPFRYWVKMDKKAKMIFMKMQETDYAYFATYPTFLRLFFPPQNDQISFSDVSHLVFSKRQASFTTEGGGQQSFKPIWEIYAVLSNREQLLAENSDEYFIRKLSRHIALLLEKDLIDETSVPKLRYSSQDLNQPYYASVLKKNLGVTQGVRERRLDLMIHLFQTKNRMLVSLYLFFTMLSYFCYVSLSNTLLKIVDFSTLTISLIELSRFGMLFIFLAIPYLVPLRISFFVNAHGITYMEQIPIFSKQYYFPKDDLYEVVVCQLQHSQHRQQGKLMLISERHLFTINTFMEDLLHFKTNLDSAIKAVLHFHFPEEVALDEPRSASFTMATQQKQVSSITEPIPKEKPFVRFAARRPTALEITPSAESKDSSVKPSISSSEVPPIKLSEKKQTEKLSNFSQVSPFLQSKPKEASKSIESPSEEIQLNTPPSNVEEIQPAQFASSLAEDLGEEQNVAPKSLLSDEIVPANMGSDSELIKLEEVLPDQMLSSDSEMIVLQEVVPEQVSVSEQEPFLLDEAKMESPLFKSKKNTKVIVGKDALERGLTLLKENQIIRAMNAFNQAIQENPTLPEAHYQMGLIHLKLFEHPEGIQSFTQAIQLNPKYSEAFEARASTYAEIGEPEKSREDYKKLIALDPSRKSEIQRKLKTILKD